MTNSMRMTLPELCKAVAEEMGFEIIQMGQGRIGIRRPNGRGGNNFHDLNWLATGTGMLEVLEWLRKEMGYPTVKFWQYDNLGGVELSPNPSLLSDDPIGKHTHKPTAVLLAFMRAVKGVDVEAEE